MLRPKKTGVAHSFKNQPDCRRRYLQEYNGQQLPGYLLKLRCAAFEAGLEDALHRHRALLTLCYSEISCMLVSDVGPGDITPIPGDTPRGAETCSRLSGLSNLSERPWRRPLWLSDALESAQPSLYLPQPAGMWSHKETESQNVSKDALRV